MSKKVTQFKHLRVSHLALLPIAAPFLFCHISHKTNPFLNEANTIAIAIATATNNYGIHFQNMDPPGKHANNFQPQPFEIALVRKIKGKTTTVSEDMKVADLLSILYLPIRLSLIPYIDTRRFPSS